MKPAEGSTVIGKSVTIRGELSGNEDLYLDGVLEGTIALRDHGLTVGPNAKVQANIHARDLVVFGTITGNLYATGKVEVRHSAVIHGDILGGRLSIEENAVIQGKVNIGGEQAKSTPDIPSVTAKAAQATLTLEPKA